MGVFHIFLNCTNGTKSRSAPHIHVLLIDFNTIVLINFYGKFRFMKTLILEIGVSDIYHCYKKFEKFCRKSKKKIFSVLDFESVHLEFKFTSNQFVPLKRKPVENNI